MIPVLRQADELHTTFGRYVLGAAAIGELGPLLLASIAFATEKHHLSQTLLSLSFIVAASAAILLLLVVKSERLSEKIVRWLGDSEILPVRIALLVLVGSVSLAAKLGVETVVGALCCRRGGRRAGWRDQSRFLEDRLTTIGAGFFVPLFFVASGVAFDLPALVSSPASLARFGLFSLAFLFIRLAPLTLYKQALPERDLPALALLTSTTLPLVVAITYLGTRAGQMLSGRVGAGGSGGGDGDALSDAGADVARHARAGPGGGFCEFHPWRRRLDLGAGGERPGVVGAKLPGPRPDLRRSFRRPLP